jgi:hypothetical protein
LFSSCPVLAMVRISNRPSDLSLLLSNSVSKSSGWQLVECGGCWEFTTQLIEIFHIGEKIEISFFRSAISVECFQLGVCVPVNVWLVLAVPRENSCVFVPRIYLHKCCWCSILIETHLIPPDCWLNLKFILNRKRQSRVCVLVWIGNIIMCQVSFVVTIYVWQSPH